MGREGVYESFGSFRVVILPSKSGIVAGCCRLLERVYSTEVELGGSHGHTQSVLIAKDVGGCPLSC